MTLRDDILASRDGLTSIVSQLDKAALAAGALGERAATAEAELAAAQARIAELEAQLPTKPPPTPPPTATKPFGGMWPDSPTVTLFESWQTRAGRFVDIYRSRGGEGQMDNPWLDPETLAMNKQGHLVSLQCQPKVGKLAARHGIPYKDITAGKYDTQILAEFAKFKQLDGRNPFEPHSEFNVQKGPVAAQPDVGPPQDYAQFVIHLHELAVKAGVRGKLIFIPSAAGLGFWSGTQWHAWLDALKGTGAMDAVGIDFYSDPNTGVAKDFASGAKSIYTVARQLKVPWWVLETGSQESPKDPTYKANWYKGMADTLAAEGKDCGGVVMNVSNDGPGGRRPDTSAQAMTAWQRLMVSTVWH